MVRYHTWDVNNSYRTKTNKFLLRVMLSAYMHSYILNTTTVAYVLTVDAIFLRTSM